MRIFPILYELPKCVYEIMGLRISVTDHASSIKEIFRISGFIIPIQLIVVSLYFPYLVINSSVLCAFVRGGMLLIVAMNIIWGYWQAKQWALTLWFLLSVCQWAYIRSFQTGGPVSTALAICLIFVFIIWLTRSPQDGRYSGLFSLSSMLYRMFGTKRAKKYLFFLQRPDKPEDGTYAAKYNEETRSPKTWLIRLPIVLVASCTLFYFTAFNEYITISFKIYFALAFCLCHFSLFISRPLVLGVKSLNLPYYSKIQRFYFWTPVVINILTIVLSVSAAIRPGETEKYLMSHLPCALINGNQLIGKFVGWMTTGTIGLFVGILISVFSNFVYDKLKTHYRKVKYKIE